MSDSPTAEGAVPGAPPAHVDYVSGEGPAGDGWAFLASVLSDPVSLVLVGGGAVAAVVAAVAYLRFADRVPDIAVARRTLSSYLPYLPWMLRLSVGLPLVGAGFAGYLFTPNVPVEARVLQVGIGFLLLFGLATRVVALVGLLAYAYALLAYGPDLLLAAEYAAGFAALVVLGPGQPSADGLLRRLAVTEGTLVARVAGDLPRAEPLLRRAGLDREAATLALRVLVGLNVCYLGVTQKWFQPERSLAVVARYDLTAVIPVSPELWVFGAGLVEALVGLLLVVGLFSRTAAAATFLLLTTTLFGLPDDPVLAHVTLFGLSSAVLVTGGGRRSLDATLVPAVAARVRGAGDDESPEAPAPGGGD